ncbi:MAG: bifunctional methylenetetrahydrofolate dehydrogenase/methenyltetrahydrofolate cyclohydrolase FolD [Thermoanaerobaculum sp.]|nr:bifunctional methylenetetrahydrofolate dehydrogenase/methenyltetrahydrofolate cyclohydrolase FolD [Thermoanaerobaculum sp.]MDW7967481.1 bifunctional methylenetetrahydrofolate dehydrogenase/methenyltetrahydrofolate cyclohydrolase FolD [Thermoanaerobaculum sp.]
MEGKPVADVLRQRLEGQVAALRERGIVPSLHAILVGDDPASAVYVRAKAKACQELGLAAQTHRLPAHTSADELADLIDRLNHDPQVDGILLQLPLPAHLPTARFLAQIAPEKDVDGFHPENVGLLWQGRPRFVPCTPAGIMELLRFYGVTLEGKRAVVVGRSDIVGKPMAALLLQANATVTVAHSRTPDLAQVCRQGQVVVAAVGRPALLGAAHVQPGAVVVDVGVNRVEDRTLVERLFPGDGERLRELNTKGYTLVGDVAFGEVAPVVAALTPVPGGVGPLTIAQLLANTVKACLLRRG